MREAGKREHFSPEEYVAIVADILRMKKNICLCRHFHRLDKQTIIKNPNISYIDVWPVNVFNPSNGDPFDTVSLFMFQLACIINLLPKWKRTHLRVFLCETNDTTRQSNFSVNSSGYEKPAEHRLAQQLKELRISATIHQISEWSSNEEFLRHSRVMKNFADNRDENTTYLSDENINRSKLYMRR